ncbi:MAG: uracil-DNA glycosylase family protein [Hyphomicrobium sp.]
MARGEAAKRDDLAALAERVRACRFCIDAPRGGPLPRQPRPVLVVSATARIAVCGQAPGARVHASGVPFSDPSGVRLRSWMGVTEAEFYDPARIAIVPMGLCFPGHDAKGGDLPPRPECARHWHGEVFAAMPQLELLLLIGRYAHQWHLGPHARRTSSETVADWAPIFARPAPRRMLPLPHPSWRNNAWLSSRPWFEQSLLPVLRREVRLRV